MTFFNRQQFKQSKATPYIAVLVFFALLAVVVLYDLKGEHDKALADASQRAMQRSQIIGQTLHSKLIATDYVLRDVLGHVSSKDLVYPDPDPKHQQAMIGLLKAKSDTIPDFFTMVFFNKDCMFTALDTGQHMGAKSSKNWCDAAKTHQGDTPMVQFVPSTESPSGKGVLSISRILRTPTGEFDGAAVAAMEIGTLQQWIEDLRTNGTGLVSLLDDSKTLIARSPIAVDQIEKVIEVPEIDAVLASPTGVVSAVRKGVDNKMYVAGFSKVKDFPLHIVYGMEHAEVLDHWNSQAIEMGISYVVMLLLALTAVHLYVKSLSSRLELESEKSRLDEREMLLQDMHDGFGSQLASAHLMAQQGEVTQEQIKQILNECMSDLYLVMDTLSSSSETLAEAIADYRYRLERRLVDVGLTLHWEIDLDGAPDVSPRIALQILRILQEAIGNILRHAKASNAWVKLVFDPAQDLLVVTVTDDGIGLPAQLPKGRGVPGMKGRARTIDADIAIGPRESALGTQIVLKLKLSQ